jgi:glycosyltransferase involved in cell wall biosynthesis
MNVLLLAPHPFLQERGTPIAVKLLTETLCRAGYHVDVLTYHEGSDPGIQGLRILRIPKPPFIKNVPIGFSLRKIVCDLYLSVYMCALIKRNRYQVLHAVEESIFLALLVKPFAKLKIIYDMDSSMADQLIEKWKSLRIFAPLFYGFERWAVQTADVVLPVCKYLGDKVQKYAPQKTVCILEDVPLEPEQPAGIAEDLRQLLNVDGVLAMYVGNLEHYQGIDLLLEAAAIAKTQRNFHLVVIGGTGSDVAKYKARAEELGIYHAVHFLGARPVGRLSAYLSQADVLVSPRIKGQNTPMKIYSYLASGKPILATNIGSHTQVLSKTCAVLVEPNPSAMAEGLRVLLEQSHLRDELGSAGMLIAKLQYSRSAYEKKLTHVYAELDLQTRAGILGPPRYQ